MENMTLSSSPVESPPPIILGLPASIYTRFVSSRNCVTRSLDVLSNTDIMRSSPNTIYQHPVIIPSDDQNQVQYANPMNDPFAEVEIGWKNMVRSNHEPDPHRHYLLPQSLHQTTTTFIPRHPNDQVLHQLNQFTFNNLNNPHKELHPNSSSPSTTHEFNNTSVRHQPTPNSNELRLPSSKARKLSLPPPLLTPLSKLDSNPPPAMMNLSMRRSDQIGLFRPPSSASASKTSFSTNDLSYSHSNLPPSSRTRLSSFSTDLEPISASPTSPNSPYSFPNYDNNNKNNTHQPQQQSVQATIHQLPLSNPPSSYRGSLPHSSSQWLPSSSSSSFSSDEERLLLRRASSSSIASIGSISSSSNSLKARRGLTKPLSLAVPQVGNHLSNSAHVLATPLRSSYDPNSKLNSNSVFSRSLPPSPRLGDFGQARAQFVGIKANVTGGFSMKRRTSIPRLTLGANIDLTGENSCQVRSSDPVRLIGRNSENCGMNTPIQLHFDPVAAGEGRRELMSSQAGVGGKGHIEVPSELEETFPYEHGPKEVLPDVFLGSEQNARDGNLLSSMGFGLIINVAKEVECPWEPATSPAPIEQANWKNSHRGQARRGLMVRPTASTPNLKRSFEGKIRISLPHQSCQPHSSTAANTNARSIEMKHLDADSKTSRPSLDYIKLPWSHDQDGLASIFSETEVFNLIDKVRELKLKTLIHCQCGVSRSATFMIGYCMREAVLFPERLDLSGRMHDAYSFVKEKSPWAGPNMGLIYQLIEYEKVLFKKRGILEEDDEMEEEDEDGEEENVSAEEGEDTKEYKRFEKGFRLGVEKVDEEAEDADDQIAIGTKGVNTHDRQLEPELTHNGHSIPSDKMVDPIILD